MLHFFESRKKVLYAVTPSVTLFGPETLAAQGVSVGV